MTNNKRRLNSRFTDLELPGRSGIDLDQNTSMALRSYGTWTEAQHDIPIGKVTNSEFSLLEIRTPGYNSVVTNHAME